MTNQDQVDMGLLADIAKVLGPVMISGLKPKGDYTLEDLFEIPQPVQKRATAEDVQELTEFIFSHLSFEQRAAKPEERTLYNNIVEMLKETSNPPIKDIKLRLKEMFTTPLKYFNFYFDPAALSTTEKNTYEQILGKIYGPDPFDFGAGLLPKTPLRLKKEVAENPQKYFAIDIDPEKIREIYVRNALHIQEILAAYVDYSAKQGKGDGKSRAHEEGEDEVDVRVDKTGWLSERAGWFSRFLHTNPLSQYGRLERRARVNEKRLANGEIGQWSEIFTVGERGYGLHDSTELENLSDEEKIDLGAEYRKRRILNPVYAVVLAAALLPGILASGRWLIDRYITKSTARPIHEYALPWGLTKSPPMEITKEVEKPVLVTDYNEHDCWDGCLAWWDGMGIIPIPDVPQPSVPQECKPKIITVPSKCPRPEPRIRYYGEGQGISEQGGYRIRNLPDDGAK